MVSVPTYLEEIKVNQFDMINPACSKNCKYVLNIGIFFDGSDNNRHRDSKNRGHSNIARLYLAYKNAADKGYFPHYLQGVGTIFTQIGEYEETTAGSAFGEGGDARVIYAMFMVVNSIYSFVNNGREMFSDTSIENLVSKNFSSKLANSPDKNKIMDGNEIIMGLNFTESLVGSERNRDRLFRCAAINLGGKLTSEKTIKNISGIYLDVFGFSRGAAQARVFCNWLHQSMFANEKLCGVSASFRILGLFDTVASVGYGGSGHGNWATMENLKIHPSVQNCIHYVALHEFRNNFPLDSICTNGIMPQHSHELIGIGSHSDIGGGYEPGEQGKGVILESDPDYPGTHRAVPDKKGDRNKLSQLPLNLMLQVARESRKNHGADSDPWFYFSGEEENSGNLVEEFDCNPHLRTSAANYFSQCGVMPGLPVEQALREHNNLYLAWRYSVTERKNGFQNLASVKYAKIVDPNRLEFYLKGEKFFAEQLRKVESLVGIYRVDASDEEKFEKLNYHPKAGEIYQAIVDRIKKTPVPIDIAVFFDMYVHDSYAGFIGKFKNITAKDLVHSVAEPKRYLTYRGMYQGELFNLNAQQRLLDKTIVTV